MAAIKISDDLHAVMVQKAAEFFLLCDYEEKGYVIKEDMARLQREVPVSKEQLNVVFDSLDDDGNGQLTYDEFTEGFANFLGICMGSGGIQGQGSENEEAEENDPNDIQAVMRQKAAELFRMCDLEERGYITKDAMQRLTGALPVSQDQLEVVFDSLDIDGNGQLTLEEFTGGFGAFLGMGPPPSNNNKVKAQELFEGEVGEIDVELEERQYQEMMRHVGGSYQFNDEDVIKAMWQKLHREEPDMAICFEEFLARLTGEIKRSKGDFLSLESALQSKNMEHEEEVKKLYEEMEAQIKFEKEKILAAEKLKEKQIKSDLEQQMREKERQLQDILAKHQEMEMKLKRLNKTESETKIENERLLREKDRLEEMLGRSQDELDESRTYINQMQAKANSEKRERARAAMALSEGIAIERESLVKQLDILKDVNKKLRDDKDEAESLETRRDERPMSLDEEIGAAEAGSEESENESTTKATSGTTTGDTSEGDEQEPAQPPRPEQNKRKGSLLSNYFPGGRPEKRASMLGTFKIDLSKTISEDDEVDLDDDDFDEEELQGANILLVSDDTADAQSLQGAANVYKRSDSTEIVYARSHDVCEDEDFLDGSRGPNSRLSRSGAVQGDSQDSVDEVFSQTNIKGLNSSAHPNYHRHGEENGEDCGEVEGRQNGLDGSRSKQNGDHFQNQRGQPVGADSENVIGESQGPKPQRVFKVIIVGDSGVGKSSFLHWFVHREFRQNFAATIGVDFQIKTMDLKDATCILQLWDTAGQERYRSLTAAYFRKADGVIVMYDVTSEKTFMSVRNWICDVQTQTEPETVVALIGNKSDSTDGDAYRPVKERDGMKLACDYDTLFYETSAKSGSKIQEAMEAMTSLLLEKEDQKMSGGLKLTTPTAKKKGCCGKK